MANKVRHISSIIVEDDFTLTFMTLAYGRSPSNNVMIGIGKDFKAEWVRVCGVADTTLLAEYNAGIPETERIQHVWGWLRDMFRKMEVIRDTNPRLFVQYLSRPDGEGTTRPYRNWWNTVP